MADDKAIVVAADGEIVEYSPRLKSLPLMTDELMEEMQIERAFNAPSLEAAMTGPSSAAKLADFDGQIVLIHSAYLRPSSVDERTGVFAIIDLECPKLKRREVVTCGSPNVLAIIARAAADKKLPLEAKVFQAPPTVKGRSGQYFLVGRDHF